MDREIKDLTTYYRHMNCKNALKGVSQAEYRGSIRHSMIQDIEIHVLSILLITTNTRVTVLCHERITTSSLTTATTSTSIRVKDIIRLHC